MPTYQYKCPECGHEYEKLQNINDDSRAKCPTCGTRGERVISGGGGLIFKSSGFYLTDYGRAGQKKDTADKTDGADKTEKSDKPAAKPEKAADKPEKAAEKPQTRKPKADS